MSSLAFWEMFPNPNRVRGALLLRQRDCWPRFFWKESALGSSPTVTSCSSEGGTFAGLPQGFAAKCCEKMCDRSEGVWAAAGGRNEIGGQ